MDIVDKRWNQMIELAIRIRYVIYINGGMATKSIVEDVMIIKEDVDRGYAHSILNHIEYHGLDKNILFSESWSRDSDEPTLSEFPELKSTKVRGLKFNDVVNQGDK